MLLVDEVIGKRRVLPDARFSRPTLTVRELLHARVDLEIEATEEARLETLRVAHEEHRIANERLSELTELARKNRGAIEWRLNGPVKPRPPTLFQPCEAGALPDRDKLIEEVEQAFAGNRFFLLPDDRQAEHLDEVVEIDRTAEALFLLLTPLRGG